MQIPTFWSRFLMMVAIGKAAIAGAGLALAAMGALDIAFAITAKDLISNLRPYYFDYATFGGGALGAIWGIITNR
jgi:hypothetical protein